jgi:glycosyltransferase involved in cell wall biosynthesis
MRIALNLLYLIPGVVGGTETYGRSLISAIAALDDDNEYIVFLNKSAADIDITPAANFRRVVCPFIAMRRVVRYGWEQGILPFQLGRERIDLVHSLGYVAPLAARAPQVVSVHDLNFLSHDGWGSDSTRRVLRFFVEQSVRRAAHVITMSEFSRSGIVNTLGVPPEKVTVTHEAAAAHFQSGESSLTHSDFAGGRPYVLAFSALPKHKNIERLIAAFESIQDNVPHSLVIAGNLPGDAEYRARLQAKAGPRIYFTGYLSNDEIGAALKGASLFAFPSLYEGFGIPVLEAQQLGVPVACSRVSAIPEVAGEGALYFDPLSVESIARALQTALLDSDLRAQMVRDGYANVSRFTWENTARRTLSVYNKVARLNRETAA